MTKAVAGRLDKVLQGKYVQTGRSLKTFIENCWASGPWRDKPSPPALHLLGSISIMQLWTQSPEIFASGIGS